MYYCNMSGERKSFIIKLTKINYKKNSSSGKICTSVYLKNDWLLFKNNFNVIAMKWKAGDLNSAGIIMFPEKHNIIENWLKNRIENFFY